MPRQPRLVVVGYPHHIILRGNNRSAIFYNDRDRRFFIECLKKAKEKTQSKIYTYCLMTNHVHLIIEPSKQDALGNMIQSLGRRYVQYINWKHKRTGTLWEGRFKSSLISKDEYLFMCNKYIELNPVRAKMVKAPGDYSWSSFGCKTGKRIGDLVDNDPLYVDLGKTENERQLNYKKSFSVAIPDERINLIRTSTQKCGVIGDKGFINKIRKLTGKKIDFRKRGRPKKSL